MAIFLGIDGGGSKTSCLIGDEHSVLGSGQAEGSNLVRVGDVRAQQALAIAVQKACAAANIHPEDICRTCIGVAGAARSEISGRVRQMIAQMVSGDIDVVGDMVIAMEAAFGEGVGVIVIAGTGSIAYGRNSEGEIARAGGWGFAISDEGSGHWIGRCAVAAALRARDEGGIATLLEKLLQAWQLSDHEQLVLAANAIPSPDFAGLSPVVLRAAESGDTLARTVLTRAGNELAGLAGIVTRRIFQRDKTVPVAMSGGVFANSALVREIFCDRLHSEYAGTALNPIVAEPARGALELARRGAR